MQIRIYYDPSKEDEYYFAQIKAAQFRKLQFREISEDIDFAVGILDFIVSTAANTADDVATVIDIGIPDNFGEAGELALILLPFSTRSCLSPKDGGGGPTKRPNRKPKNVPRGTKAIDKHPDTKDIVHKIKNNLRDENVGAASYVGIAPNGNVILTNCDGSAYELNHWTQYL